MAVTDIFPVDPDYPVAVDILDGVLRQSAQDGTLFARAMRADRRQFRLEFRSRPTTELHQLLAWQRRMRDQVFLFHHKVWERGSWNLLGTDAESELISPTFYSYNGFQTPGTVTLTELGLKVGDIISFGGEAKVGNAADFVFFRLWFRDSDEATIISSSSTTTSSLSYVEIKKENVAIPDGTVTLSFLGAYSGVAGNHFFRRAKLNRGATFEPFEAAFNNEEYVPRFFPVRFASPVRHRLSAHESHDIEVDLVEVVGTVLDELHHPDPLDLSTSENFLEESEGTALVGTWTDATFEADAHNKNEKSNPGTTTAPADEFAFTYSGYGFRLWARKDTDLGICKVLLDDVDIGDVDLYAAAAAASAPLLTKLDVALGLHTVKIQSTNTANGSSSDKIIVADAIEFMP